jgi:plastocyanin
MHGAFRPLATAALLCASVGLGLAGCGSDDGAVDLSGCVSVEPADGVTKLTITGRNLAFVEECFQVEPGPVEITFVNDDGGVSHNIHVKGPGDVNEATPLERGKVTQVLEVDLVEPGTYRYVCDPHPSMKGNIVVGEATEA